LPKIKIATLLKMCHANKSIKIDKVILMKSYKTTPELNIIIRTHNFYSICQIFAKFGHVCAGTLRHSTFLFVYLYARELNSYHLIPFYEGERVQVVVRECGLVFTPFPPAVYIVVTKKLTTPSLP
jgi:hypothetical protein